MIKKGHMITDTTKYLTVQSCRQFPENVSKIRPFNYDFLGKLTNFFRNNHHLSHNLSVICNYLTHWAIKCKVVGLRI